MVIGISTDTLALQKQFAEKENLNFPIFADADKTASKAYGVLPPGGKYARRETFVIDKQGVIRKIYPSANPSKNPAAVLDFLKTHLK